MATVAELRELAEDRQRRTGNPMAEFALLVERERHQPPDTPPELDQKVVRLFGDSGPFGRVGRREGRGWLVHFRADRVLRALEELGSRGRI